MLSLNCKKMSALTAQNFRYLVYNLVKLRIVSRVAAQLQLQLFKKHISGDVELCLNFHH